MAGFRNSTPNTNKQKTSKNGPQLLEAAVKAHKTGDITNAEKLYLNAINSGFHHEIAFSNLGVIYKNTGRREKAIAIYERAITINQNFADAHTNLGNLYKDLGNLDQALVSTLKSLELKPDNPDALITLGGICIDIGKLDQALASTLKSLELKPDNPNAHMNLGITHEILNELDNALESYAQSAKLIVHHKEESSLTSLISTSIILLQMNRIDDAKKALSNALEIELNKEMLPKSSSIKNKKHNKAYLYYLSKLIPKIPRIAPAAESQILHLGDSHCLTFTNQTIKFNEKNSLLNHL